MRITIENIHIKKFNTNKNSNLKKKLFFHYSLNFLMINEFIRKINFGIFAYVLLKFTI